MDALLREPGPRFRELAVREKLHRRIAETCSRKSERRLLMARLSHDGDLHDLVAVPVEKIEVAPRDALLPAFEVFEEGENARFYSTINIAGSLILHAVEFGTLHLAAEAQHIG